MLWLATLSAAVVTPTASSALVRPDSTRAAGSDARAPVPVDTAPLLRVELWGGVSPGSSRWGSLGATPGVRLALGAVRLARRLTDASGPASTRAWWYTVDLIPLTLLSPPYRSTPGAPGCLHTYACVAPRASHGAPVYAAGASPLGLTYVWRASQRVQASLGSTGGFLWSTQPVPTTRAARFNYTAALEGGVRFASATGPELALVYRFHHLSNAATAPENPAIASHVLSASVGWYHARTHAAR